MLVTALALVLAACPEEEPDEDVAEPDDDAVAEPDDEEEEEEEEPEEELPVVRIQGLDTGMAALAASVIDEEGFDTDHGFEGDYHFIPPAAATQAFLQRETDVSFDSGPPEVALGAGAGVDIVAISGGVRNHTSILVPGDSDAESIDDLVGQRVGHFSPDSTATMSITMILDAFYDIEYDGDFELVLNPPPALLELMDAGEIDGTEAFHPHWARGVTQFGFRSLWDPEETWQEETGGTLWTTTVAVHRDWVAEDPETAENVLAAWCDASDYINNNPQEIIENERYVDLFGLDEDGMQVWADYTDERREAGFEYTSCDWTDDEIENINLFFDMLAERGIGIAENPGDVAQPLEDVIADLEEEE